MSAFSLPAALPRFAPASSRSGVRDVRALQLLSSITASLAITFQLLWYQLSDPAPTLNVWIPVALAGTCCWGVILLVYKNPLWTWSPLVAALAAMAAFHGLGPLLHVFGNPSAIAYANEFAPIDSEELARTNLLDCWSLASILLSCTLFFRVRSRKLTPSTSRNSGTKTTKVIGWALICVALPIKYFVVLPYFLGWTDPDFILPGFVVFLGNLSLLALFLLLYHAWSGSKAFYIPAAILLTLELITGLLAFNKTEILSTLGVAFLGLYFVRPSRMLAAIAVSVIAIAYLIVTPIVSQGRLRLGINPASLSERIDALELVWHADNDAAPRDGVQGWWSRLCYANAQAFCLRQYDAGIPGHTFELILPSVVPRILWPEKPIMTPGFDFNQLVTRNPHSSSAAGVFAEAYWNAGWLGVILTTTYLGFLFSWFTKIAFRYVAARDIRWLPFGIGGLLMGASLTDWFASTYVGGAITYIVYFAVIHALIPGANAPRARTT